MDTIRRPYCKGQVLPNFKGLASEGAILVPLFTRLMTSNGAIWFRDQRSVIMR